MFGRRRERRALPPGAAVTMAGPGHPIDRYSAEAHGIDQALQHSAVWACVRLLADTVSTLPVDVYRGGEQIDTPRLLLEPASGQPAQEFLYSVMASLLLRGNVFGLITARSGPGLWPSQCELCHPDRVGISADPNTGAITYRIGGREYGRADVWHVRAFTLPGVALGLSPIDYQRQTVGVGLAAQVFGADYFASGGVPLGQIILDDDASLPPVDVADNNPGDAILDSWARLPRRRAGLMVGMKFEPISVSPEESQFLATQAANVAAIARIYGVPVEMIVGEAGNSLTYANTEARALDYVRYSLTPWIVRLETALGRLLPAPQRVKLNADALLRGTTTERFAAYPGCTRRRVHDHRRGPPARRLAAVARRPACCPPRARRRGRPRSCAMSVDASGLQETLRRFALEKAQSLGDAFVARAQSEAPVATGALAASIHAEGPYETATGAAVRVVADSPHAVYVERGRGPERAEPGKAIASRPVAGW